MSESSVFEGFKDKITYITEDDYYYLNKGYCPKCKAHKLCDLSLTGFDGDQCGGCLTIYVTGEKE